MRPQTMKTVLGSVIAALAVTAPAPAATVGMSGSTLTYQAAAGEKNLLRIDTSPQAVYFTDTGASITTGPGCSRDENGNVLCSPAGVSTVAVLLGDGDDDMQEPSRSLESSVPPGAVLRVDGGPGKDKLIGTKGNDVLRGGAGNDNIFGSGGKDTIEGGAGNDRLTGYGTVKGGAGGDFLEIFYLFSDKWPPVSTKAYGGSGNDVVISGNKVRDRIDCGTGRDRATSTDKPGFDRMAKSCETGRKALRGSPKTG